MQNSNVMIWLYRIGLLLNLVLVVYAAFNVKNSGVYNRTVIWGIVLLIVLMAIAYLLKSYYGMLRAAIGLLYLPLIPVLLFLLFLLLMIIIKPDFK